MWYIVDFPGDSVGGDGRLGYRSQSRHSYSRKGDSRGDGAIHGSRSEDINYSSLFNVGESFYGIGRSGSKSHTSPSSSHNSGYHGRLYSFNSYGYNRSGHMSHTIQFSAYNHGGLKRSHPKSLQEDIPRDMHGENLHQNHPYYSYSSMKTHPRPIMPPHPHENMPPHIYPSIPAHQVCLCPYFISTPTY